MIYLLHVEQVVREVLQSEFTWLKEINNCPILIVWDSMQPKNEISTPPRASLCNFTITISVLNNTITNVALLMTQWNLGRGRSWKECFEILACCLALSSYTTKEHLGVYLKLLHGTQQWGEGSVPLAMPPRSARKVSPRSIPSQSGNSWALYAVMWCSPLLFKNLSPKSHETRNREDSNPLVPTLPLQTSWIQSTLLTDMCSLCF